MDSREKQHQKLYLEMYQKGKDCARIEREEEVNLSLALYSDVVLSYSVYPSKNEIANSVLVVKY